MIFVRVAVNHDTGRIIAVATSDRPLPDKLAVDEPAPEGADPYRCEMVDLGVVEDHEWSDLNGNATTPDRHIFERLEANGVRSSDIIARDLRRLAAAAALRELHAAPCTPLGIRAHFRAGRGGEIRSKVRAWIACTLSPRDAEALGLLAGIPISVAKAVDAVRTRRDPQLGSNRERLERLAQRFSDIHSARHRKRLEATFASPPKAKE